MPRICAPVSKQLSRSVSSSVTAAARTAGHKNAGAVLMPKYAELLGKNEQSDVSDLFPLLPPTKSSSACYPKSVQYHTMAGTSNERCTHETTSFVTGCN